MPLNLFFSGIFALKAPKVAACVSHPGCLPAGSISGGSGCDLMLPAFIPPALLLKTMHT